MQLQTARLGVCGADGPHPISADGEAGRTPYHGGQGHANYDGKFAAAGPRRTLHLCNVETRRIAKLGCKPYYSKPSALNF